MWSVNPDLMVAESVYRQAVVLSAKVGVGYKCYMLTPDYGASTTMVRELDITTMTDPLLRRYMV